MSLIVLDDVWALGAINPLLDVAHLLVERSLARRDDDGRLVLHDLQHDYAILRTGDIKRLHRQLIDGYRATLLSGDWSGLERGEPYLWDHLMFHLSEARLLNELRSVGGNVAYLGKKAFLRRGHAAADDISDAWLWFADDKELAALERVVRGHAHLFAGIRSPAGKTARLRFWKDGSGAKSPS